MSYLSLLSRVCAGFMLIGFMTACGGGSSTPPPPEFSAASLAAGEVNASYDAVTFTASNGALPLSWSLAAGELPEGLALSTTGTLSGTPTTSGTYAFTLAVTDARNRTAEQPLSLVIIDAPPQISTTSLADGDIDLSYSSTLAASDGAQPLTWSVTSGTLPDGMALSATGALTGTPTTSGIFQFTVEATDALDRSDQQMLSMLIINAVPEVATTTLASGTLDLAYSETISVSGGNAPFEWALVSGTLPAGLSLSTAGTLSGTPTEHARTPFTLDVQVTDSLDRTATGTVTLSVLPPTLTGVATVSRIDLTTREPLWTIDLSYDYLTQTLVSRRSQPPASESNPNPPLSLWQYSYDADHRLTQIEYLVDGVATRFDYFDYDANGYLTLEEFDLNGDETINRRYSYTNSAAGDQLERRFDNNADGLPDRVETYSYAAPGHPATRTLDVQNDGLNELSATWSYGADPARATQLDLTYTATTELVTFSWSDNPDGTLTMVADQDYDSDNTIDERTITTFPAGADLRWEKQYESFTAQQYDFDVDDIIDYTLLREFDAEGRLLEVLGLETGRDDAVTQYSYDAEGRLNGVRTLSGSDITGLWTVTYTDWYLDPVDLMRTPAASIPNAFLRGD